MNLNETSEALGNAKNAPMADIQHMVFCQANLLFPKRTPSSAFMKLFEELGEVIKDPTDAKEWADVFILCLDLARIHGVTDLASAILAKMAENQMREWVETGTGTFQHVPGATAGDLPELPAPAVQAVLNLEPSTGDLPYGGIPC